MRPLIPRWLGFTLLAAAGCAGGTGPTVPAGDESTAGSASSVGRGPTNGVRRDGLRFYLDAGGERLELLLRGDRWSLGQEGMIRRESDGAFSPVDAITYEPSSGRLDLRRTAAEGWDWYHARITDGILVGRIAHTVFAEKPNDFRLYDQHVTGWSDALDRDITPRVWEVAVDGYLAARLRIDRSVETASGFTGRMKIYAAYSIFHGGEQREVDLDVTSWDGAHLAFVIHDAAGDRRATATASGRTISGTIVDDAGGSEHALEGARAEVLGFGLRDKAPTQRDAWQARTRRRLEHLLMGGNPAPLTSEVEILASGLPPVAGEAYTEDRDDDRESWPQRYEVTALAIHTLLEDPYGGENLSRRAHGFLAVPTERPPSSGFPAVIALNGHDGSAAQLLQPGNDLYWYGDAYARRSYVVLALDVSHRPVVDRPRFYHGYPNGDDPANGNGSHPAIEGAGMDSDWEENGERAWDVMRALDYLRTVPGVDPSRIIVTGLSMGGEIATYAAALDPRFSGAVSAGFSPDLGVILHHGNHDCWRWQHGDPREYFDVSDLQSLIAPRPLVVETGRVDRIFSSFTPPFASDKQVARRARLAYADHPERYVHYLHYDAHRYHVGDFAPAKEVALGIQVPVAIAPSAPWSIDWQSDPETRSNGMTLFDYLETMLQP